MLITFLTITQYQIIVCDNFGGGFATGAILGTGITLAATSNSRQARDPYYDVDRARANRELQEMKNEERKRREEERIERRRRQDQERAERRHKQEKQRNKKYGKKSSTKTTHPKKSEQALEDEVQMLKEEIKEIKKEKSAE